MKKIILSIAIACAAGLSAMAQERTAERTPGVNTRQAAQRARIYEGNRSGELTPAERRLLNAEQRRIHRSERRVRADGDVTREERARLQRRQNRASRHIRRAKNNNLDNQ